MELLEDEEIRSEADDLRERAREGEALDDLLPEAFALCREAARRNLGQRHFDVQLIGGMVLHDGSIAEMKTGEGKTLTATLAVFLNSLAGDPVHLVTVNDYLARRDADWMAPIYDALGVSVGAIQAGHEPEERQRGLRLRRRLRDQLRVRLRLPARQHGGHARALRAARPRLRDRRRGGQHPDRRGAHAADHLRRPRGGGRPLLHLRPARQADGRGPGQGEAEVPGRGPRHHRASTTTTSSTRSTRRSPPPSPGVAKAERFLGVDNLYVSEHGTLVNHLIQSLKAESLFQPRRRLRGDRRRGEDRRRVHRPDPRGAALVRGPPPGDRGQGGRPDPRGEPDPGDDHPPELLPPLRQALRDDGHGAHRGAGVHEDLRDAGGRHPDQRADGPRRTTTTRSTRPRTASGRRSRARSRSDTSRASRSSSGRSPSRSRRCSRAS